MGVVKAGPHAHYKHKMSGRCNCCSFACAVCKILCFSCCRRLCCKSPPPPKPEYAVLCLGFGGAGKSTLLASLCGERESEAAIEPTIGFSIKSTITERAVLSIKEIGGSEKIRPYWEKYYSGHDAIIFVVDCSSCTDEQLQEIRTCLEKILSNSGLRGLPLLVLCNKQDLAAAMPVDQIASTLKLNELSEGRWHAVRGSSCHDIDNLKRSLEELAERVQEERGGSI